MKAMCGTTCARNGSLACAAIPDSGSLTIFAENCTDADFPYRNTSSMQFGTGKLDVVGDCCYEGFSSAAVGGDLANFDCSAYDQELCDHPAYGQFLRAVCPDMCGSSCLNQLWVEARDGVGGTPSLPPLHGRQTSTQCTGVTSSRVDVYDPTSNPAVVTHQTSLRSDECCDFQCDICDTYFAVLSANRTRSYSSLNCTALTEELPTAYRNAGYTCYGCACSLDHDDDKVYPSVVCRNSF